MVRHDRLVAQCQGWKLIAIKIRGSNSYRQQKLVEEGDGKVVLNHQRNAVERLWKQQCSIKSALELNRNAFSVATLPVDHRRILLTLSIIILLLVEKKRTIAISRGDPYYGMNVS